MIKDYKLKILILLLLVVIQSCDQNPCRRGDNRDKAYRDYNEKGRDCGKGSGYACVEADDWGYPKVWVPGETRDIIKEHNKDLDDSIRNNSRTAKGGALRASGNEVLGAIRRSSEGIVSGDYPFQTIRPFKTSQIILGIDQPLVLTVSDYDGWSSWYGGFGNLDEDGNKIELGYDNGKEVPKTECHYQVTRGAAPAVGTFPYPGFDQDLAPAIIYQDLDNPDDNYYFIEDSLQFAKIDFDSSVTPLDYSSRNRSQPFEETSSKMFANSYAPCTIRHGFGLYVGFAPNGRDNVTYRDALIGYHIPDAKIPGTPDDINIVPDATNDIATNYRVQNNIPRGMDGYLVLGLPQFELPLVTGSSRLFFKIMDRYYDDNEGGYVVRIKEGTRSYKRGGIEKMIGFFEGATVSILERIYRGIVTNPEYIAFVRAVLTLFIVFYGYKILIGSKDLRKEDNLKYAVSSILKMSIIFAVIGENSWDFFYNTVFSAFLDGITDISTLLVSPFQDYDPNSPWYSMEKVLIRMFSPETFAKISSLLISHFPIGLIYIIVIYLLLVVFLFAVLKAVVISLVSFIALAILISLAPIFIVFILFEQTKNLFDEWLNQLIAFSMEYLILLASIGMFAALLVNYMERTIGYRVCWNQYFDIPHFGIGHVHGFRYWMPDISDNKSLIWLDLDNDGIRSLSPREEAYRFTDLPYFDPIHDRELIKKYMKERNFVDFIDVMVLMLACYLMYRFIVFVPQLASLLKGGSPNDTSSRFDSYKSSKSQLFAASKQTLSFAGNTTKKAFSRLQKGKYKKSEKGFERSKSRVRREMLNKQVAMGSNLKDASGTSSASSSKYPSAFDNKPFDTGKKTAGAAGSSENTNRDSTYKGYDARSDKASWSIGKEDTKFDSFFANSRFGDESSKRKESRNEKLRRGKQLRREVDNNINALKALKKQYGDNYLETKLNGLEEFKEAFILSEGAKQAGKDLSDKEINKIMKFIESDKFDTLDFKYKRMLIDSLGKSKRGLFGSKVKKINDTYELFNGKDLVRESIYIDQAILQMQGIINSKSGVFKRRISKSSNEVVLNELLKRKAILEVKAVEDITGKEFAKKSKSKLSKTNFSEEDLFVIEDSKSKKGTGSKSNKKKEQGKSQYSLEGEEESPLNKKSNKSNKRLTKKGELLLSSVKVQAQIDDMRKLMESTSGKDKIFLQDRLRSLLSKQSKIDFDLNR